MNTFYYTPALPDSFGSVTGLKRQSAKPKRKVTDFLVRQDAYTLHRDIKRRFPRRKTLSLGIDDLWQSDLVDLSTLARSNDGYRYLLTCIDVFSKYARVAILKTKAAAVVASAFETLLEERKPKHLQTDKGTEFLNITFQQLLADNGIKHYTSENDDIKCAVVERWHRTILAKLYRYFTFKNTTRYIDVIQDIVRSYNDTPHSSIKVAPSEVNEHNESAVRERLFTPIISSKGTVKFKVGDTVRISGVKHRIPTKGYRDKWSEEVFKIVKVHNTKPVTFGLTDYDGEEIKGKFYNQELQRVIKETFRIEQVIKTRRRAGKTEYYVKWLGYPEKFNSWVDHINA
jgi:transposase InsO family protein